VPVFSFIFVSFFLPVVSFCFVYERLLDSACPPGDCRPRQLLASKATVATDHTTALCDNSVFVTAVRNTVLCDANEFGAPRRSPDRVSAPAVGPLTSVFFRALTDIAHALLQAYPRLRHSCAYARDFVSTDRGHNNITQPINSIVVACW